MIHNLEKLHGDGKTTRIEKYKLRLLQYSLLEPVHIYCSEIWITSGHRTRKRQMRQPLARRAKGRSQHEDAEAVDFWCADPLETFLWIYANLKYWQLILYFKKGVPGTIHLSMMSQRVTVKKKSLYNVDGKTYYFSGSFEHAEA